MHWRDRPTCATCTSFNTEKPSLLTVDTERRMYTPEELAGGRCSRASTPFRTPATSVCACYEGSAFPWWTKLTPYTELRVRRSLAQESLDTVARVYDDAAVLRCALSGAWRRASEARARSHELWASLHASLHTLPPNVASVWKDRFTNVTIAVSRWLMTMGDQASMHAIAAAGIESLGIVMPERDTGALCEHCGELLGSLEHIDPATKEMICRACAKKIGLVTEEQR